MTLRAGSDSRDISPGKPMALFGYPHVRRISTGIHDPLLASALYLENDGAKAVLVALDLLFLDPPTARRLRRAVARTTGAPEECVFISCTHTHSGPVTVSLLAWRKDVAVPAPCQSYHRRVRQQVVLACRAARDRARPAELAWTTADATGAGGNRISPSGVIDPACGLLSIRTRRSRKMLSVALVYGMHPTVLHEDSTLVSSDFPHYTREQLRDALGRSLVVLYLNGPCGNQSPRYFVKGQTFAEAERLGRKLGRFAAGALDALRENDWCGDPVLAGRKMRVALPRRKLLSPRKARQTLAAYRRRHDRLVAQKAPHPEVRTAECAVFGAESAVCLAEAGARGGVDRLLKRYRPIEVQALRIGPACLVGLPGESFTEYALAIKRSVGMRAFVVGLVNGELQGYIVTPEAAARGGYEAANALFAPQAGERLVAAARTLADSLRKGEDS